MENTESPVEKEEETNDATESETQQQKEETPPPQKPPKKPKFGIKRRKDGSIRTLVFKADTDHPVLVQTGIAGNIFLNIISFILFVVTVIASLYYIIILSKSEFHSDCTDTIMWANASYEAGSIYDPNFKYACFLPFGTNILMYPFIGITGLSLKTHIIGMTGFFIITTLCFMIMLKVMKVSFKGICFSTSAFLALTLSSKKLREIFWGHTIYYSLGILFLIIAVLLFFRISDLSEKKRILKEKNERTGIMSFRLTIIICLFCLFMMLAGTDGISALSICILPFLAAIAAEYFVDSDNRIVSTGTAEVIVKILIVALMTVLGILLNNAWTGDLVAGYQDANSEYSAMAEWPDHVRNLPLAWMRLLGVQNMTDQMLMKGQGLINLFYIVCAVMLAVMPVIATVCYPKYSKKDRPMRYWVWIHWGVTVIVLLGYICGILSAADWRITPIFGTSLILTILFVGWAVKQKTSISRLAVLFFVPCIIVCFLNVGLILSTPKDRYEENDLFQLAETLEGYGLDEGYATFWNCNSITVISGNKVKVREVTVNENGVNKRHYQSSKKWFEEMEDTDECFLLLSSYEYSVLNENDLDLKNKATQTYDVKINNNLYYILVFDENIL